MRNAPRRVKPDPRGLEAARKRLWPDGSGPVASPHCSPPEPELEALASVPDADDAPTLPLLPPPTPSIPPSAAIQAPPTAPRRMWMIGSSAALVTAALFAGVGSPKAQEGPSPGWNLPPVENLTVRGAIRIVDAHGNEVAVFGNVPSGSDATEVTALALRSEGRDTVRLESLPSGATLKLDTPDRHSSMTLVSGDAGPYLLMSQGAKQRAIGPDDAPTSSLPAVSSGPTRASLDLLDRRAQPLGDGLFAVDLRVGRGRVRGRILNTTSVRHTGIEVDVRIGDASLPLRVPIVSPGNSTGFSAALPAELPEALLRSASVERVSSTLRYDAHKPGSEAARTR